MNSFESVTLGLIVLMMCLTVISVFYNKDRRYKEVLNKVNDLDKQVIDLDNKCAKLTVKVTNF